MATSEPGPAHLILILPIRVKGAKSTAKSSLSLSITSSQSRGPINTWPTLYIRGSIPRNKWGFFFYIKYNARNGFIARIGVDVPQSPSYG